MVKFKFKFDRCLKYINLMLNQASYCKFSLLAHFYFDGRSIEAPIRDLRLTSKSSELHLLAVICFGFE